jgi:aspartate beta-hydroxylase
MVSPYDLVTRALRSFYGIWIDTPPILDAAIYFPHADVLDRNWCEIRREVLDLVNEGAQIPKFHELIKNQVDISDNDSIAWRLFVLKAFGRDQHANQSLCPVTARLLGSIPNVISASFSILDSKKHIPAHRGPYRGFLRYHLGLQVPKDAAGTSLAVLRVAERRYRWREGEGILWDDTYEHEVWNHGDSPRIVLIVDIARPGMPGVLRIFDQVIYGFVAHSKGLRSFLARSEIDGERRMASIRGTTASTPVFRKI